MSNLYLHHSTTTLLRLIALFLAGLWLCSGCRSTKSESEKVEPAEIVPEKIKEWKELYEEWEEDDPIPDFQLIDHEGKGFSLGDHDRKYLLFGFVFTRCQVPKACPLTMKKMKEVQKLWETKKESGLTGDSQLQLFGITLDPEFDTPDILKGYLRAHGGNKDTWSMATGPEELVATALPSLFNIMALPDGKGSINHSVKVALLSPGRVFLKDWKDNEFAPEDVVQVILEQSKTTAK